MESSAGYHMRFLAALRREAGIYQVVVGSLKVTALSQLRSWRRVT